MVGAGAGKGGEEGQSHKRVGRGTDTCVCVLLQGGDKDCSAMHYASENGLESAVAKLLSLGADAAFKDEVRACSLAHCLHTHYHVCQDAFRISLHALMHAYTHM